MTVKMLQTYLIPMRAVEVISKKFLQIQQTREIPMMILEIAMATDYSTIERKNSELILI